MKLWAPVIGLGLVGAAAVSSPLAATASATVPARAVSAESSAAEVRAAFSRGSQADADRLLADARTKFSSDTRLAFYEAAFARTKNAAGATLLLKAVASKNDGVFSQAATLAVKADEGNKAAADALQAVASKSGDPTALWLSASVNEGVGQLAPAVASYRELLRRASDAPVTVTASYARLLEQQGDFVRALPVRVADADRAPSPQTLTDLSMTLSSMKRAREAASVAERGVKKFADSADLWFAWGSALMDQGEHAQAVTRFARAIETCGKLENWSWAQETLLNWGASLEALGKNDEALARYEQASKLDAGAEARKRVVVLQRQLRK